MIATEDIDGPSPNKWTVFAEASRLGYATHSYKHQGVVWYDFYAASGRVVPTELNSIRTTSRTSPGKSISDRIFIEASGSSLRDAADKVRAELEDRREEFGLKAA